MNPLQGKGASMPGRLGLIQAMVEIGARSFLSSPNRPEPFKDPRRLISDF
jgi:hypothetical protein